MDNKRFMASILEIVVGAVLCIVSFTGVLDEYWGNMGGALVIGGAVMLLRQFRYKINNTYREKIDVQTKDERNRYIALKSWAWAGYLFVILGAVASIALRIAGMNDYSVFAAFCVCLIMVLYWISYVILHKKY